MKWLSYVMIVLVSSHLYFSCKSNSDSQRSGSGNKNPATSVDPNANAIQRQQQINQQTTNPSSTPQTSITTMSTDGDHDCYKADQQICAIELAIVKLTNGIRAIKGLAPLKHHNRLSYVARNYSAKGIMGHDGFPEQRISDYKSEFKVEDVSFYAENVAMGGDGSNVEAAAAFFVDMWKNSSGHLSNILSDATYLGVGVSSKSGEYFATQIFGY